MPYGCNYSHAAETAYHYLRNTIRQGKYIAVIFCKCAEQIPAKITGFNWCAANS